MWLCSVTSRRGWGTHCVFFFNSSVFSLQSLWVWGLWACCVVAWIDLNFHKLFIIVITIIIIVRVCVCHRVRMEARGQILGSSLSCFSQTKHSMTRAPVSFQVIPYLHRSSYRRSAGSTDVYQPLHQDFYFNVDSRDWTQAIWSALLLTGPSVLSLDSNFWHWVCVYPHLIMVARGLFIYIAFF